MSKNIYLILSFLIFLYVPNVLGAQSTDTLHTDFEGHHFIEIQNDTNQDLLIFLHGGINNPALKDSSKARSLDFLLEGNTSIVSAANERSMDVFIPVSDDSLNWLNKHNYCFEVFQRFIRQNKQYKHVYIAGFSDGGTGSYKIFYEHVDSFSGLLLLNGYPQHKNFNKTVEYSKNTKKAVVFASTFSDDVIPYEFILGAYAEQKPHNSNTYCYVVKGKHSLSSYTAEQIEHCFELMLLKYPNVSTIVFHGLIENDRPKSFYTYRKKVVRKYGYGKELYRENKRQQRALKRRKPIK